MRAAKGDEEGPLRARKSKHTLLFLPGPLSPSHLLPPCCCFDAGHCDQYANRSALRIVDVRPSSQFVCHGNERYPPYFHEALACFSRHPLSHINGSELRSGLVHVDTAWMGLGPRCRGSVSGCYQAGGPRLPPTPGLMASWRRVLGQCFEFDPEAAAPLHPVRLLLVDRLYESGRWGQRRQPRQLMLRGWPGSYCRLQWPKLMAQLLASSSHHVLRSLRASGCVGS